jgi:acyl dehydratase
VTLHEGWRDHGHELEDFTVGDVYRHWPGRTITETDNIHFTLLTGNPSAMHLDAHLARSVGHPGTLVNGGLILSIVHGLSVRDISSSPAAIAQLSWDNVRIHRPTYPGDTLYAESEVLEVRPSKSKADRGIVRVHTRGLNQRSELVVEYERSVLVHRRGCTPAPPARTDNEKGSD